MFDAFKVGEKLTAVIPSTIDVDFFDSVGWEHTWDHVLEGSIFIDKACNYGYYSFFL